MKEKTFFTIKDNYIVFGIGLGLFFWIFESILHTYVFHEAGFVEELFTPNVHEIWMRLMVMFLFLMVGIYAQIMVNKNRRTMEELKKYRLHLKGLVKERTAELSTANEQLQRRIIEQKRMEELLRESEAKYATLVEQAKDGVIVVQDDIFKFANMAMAKITGYSIEEMVGKSYSDMVLSEYKNASSSKKKVDMVDKISPFFYEGKILCKNGVIKDAEISAAMIKFNGENARMGIIRDITGRKKIEEELQEIEKLESIGILAGGIAHDFGNLLTTIVANLSLGKIYAKSDKKVFEVLTEAEKASNQAQKLTQQLLTFSKGKEPIKEVVSISKLLADTVSFTLSGSKTRCDLSLPEDLWCAEIDEGQIVQVINNLIMNANQAMPKGGIIRVSAENLDRTDDALLMKDALLLRGGKFVKITIKDEGVGISEKFLHHIFEPYFTTKQEGSGLGLSIVYSIIKKHEGYITAESEVGVGTTFHIYLPASEKEVFVVQNVVEEKLHSGKGKILFMDDQKGIRTIIGRVLARLGYDVEFTSSGEEAIKLYKEAKTLGRGFDVVILDLTIPGGMGGEEAIQKLLKIDPEIKAIVSSAYSKHPIMSEYRKYGFRGVIVKPYEIEKLSETLCKLMEEKEEILQKPPAGKQNSSTE